MELFFFTVFSSILTLWTSVGHILPFAPISKPTQVPSISLALCQEPMHPSDPIAKRPLPRPFYQLTPHLLTQCLTLPLTSFFWLPTVTTYTRLPPQSYI